VAEFVFSPRYSHLLPEEMRHPDLATLGQIILHPDGPGWQFSEAGIDYLDGGRRAHLIVLRDSDLGYYLHYIGPRGINNPDDIWLSLRDRGRLGEIVCPDDWHASAGLFVPPPVAWEAIRYFCTTGVRSPCVDWIGPREMPENGNC
jgi:hypothetical protein